VLPELAAHAAQRSGLFTAAQALSCGLSRADVAREWRRGHWHRFGRGVFMATDLWETLDDRDRHLAQARARLVALGPAWALARRSAVVGYQLSHLGKQPTASQLLGAKGRAKARSRHERIATLPDEDVTILDGFRTTSLERTMVDVSRKETFRGAVVIADSALGSGADLSLAMSIGRRCASWPGGTGIAAVLRFADGRSESALESISRVAMLRCGLPMPEPQVEVYLGPVLLGRVDFFWRHHHLVGECDGLSKYVDTDVVVKEKLREELITSTGLGLVRWNWDHAWREAEMERRIRQGMREGFSRLIDPRLRFVSTSPRSFPAPV
jgi:hypothetical protein